MLRLLSDNERGRLERSIEAVFKRPFTVEGQEIRVTSSLGLARAPDHGSATDVLMQHADIALYEAKKRGRDQWVYYSNEMAASCSSAGTSSSSCARRPCGPTGPSLPADHFLPDQSDNRG